MLHVECRFYVFSEYADIPEPFAVILLRKIGLWPFTEGASSLNFTRILQTQKRAISRDKPKIAICILSMFSEAFPGFSTWRCGPGKSRVARDFFA